MISHTVRSLGNGITEISGSTDTAANSIVFVKRDSIAAIEHRRRFQEIRIDIVGKETPITLRYVHEKDGDELMSGLHDCFKDAPGAIENELQEMRGREAATRTKIDMLKEQMTELRVLLEQIATNTTPAEVPEVVENEMEVEEVDSAVGPTDLAEYETLSECEEQKARELLNFNDTVILVITLLLMCIFLSSAYLNFSK